MAKTPPIQKGKKALNQLRRDMDEIAKIIMAPDSMAGAIIRAYQTYPARRNNPSSHGD